MRRALQAPIRQIAENAGVEGSIVVGKVLVHRGKVLADGRPADIPSRMPGSVVKVAADDRNAAFDTLEAAPGVADVAVFGTSNDNRPLFPYAV